MHQYNILEQLLFHGDTKMKRKLNFNILQFWYKLFFALK